MRRGAWSVLIFFAASLAAGPLRADGSGAALQIVAARLGVPAAQLAIVSRASETYDLLGMTVEAFKIAAPDGEVYGVVVDAHGGEVDPEALEAAEAEVYERTYGKLDEDLYDFLLVARPGEVVPVSLWLDVASEEGGGRPEMESGGEGLPPTEAEVDALFAAADKAQLASLERSLAEVADRLGRLGLDFEAEELAPLLHVDLPVELIGEVGAWPEVGAISLGEDAAADLFISRQVIGADVVEGRGIDGRGVRVGQVEVGGRVAVANPFLGRVVQDATNVCAAVSDHATGVAGVIASTDLFERGIAPQVDLWAGGSCRGRNREIFRRASAAADWGARAINLSFTLGRTRHPNNTDRFFDDMVQNRWRTIVKSAGNEAGPCRSGTGNITHPGLGYNVLTVGAFDTRGSVDLADDQMWECSSWRDPLSRHGDREKPEVAAPGANIFSTTLAFPWTGLWGSGTSASAPMVTAATALLIDRNAFFSVWPEAVKAVLMATARHNIEGDPRLSENDGAGGVDLALADEVASGTRGGFGGRAYSCSTARNLDVATLNLVAGARARIVIAWDTNPGFLGYRNRPSADLDLRVLAPNGQQVAGSASWDNTYEIVDFTPAVTGSFRLRVHRYRCGANPKWLGWGWYQEPRPPRRGMTWAKVDHASAFGTDKFNCAGCDPYVGDTLCDQARPVLCIRADGSPNPGLPVNFYDGWIGGTVALSTPVRGDQLLGVAAANALCSAQLGPGWQMAEFHHPLGGWGWSSYGNVSAANRMWVFINDQPGNCWN